MRKTLLDFDSINRPEYEEYFSKMYVSEEGLIKRVSTALILDNRILDALAKLERQGYKNIQETYERMYAAYMDTLDDLEDADEEYLEQRAIQFAEEVTKSTYKGLQSGKSPFTADRAVNAAKSESNVINNYRDYSQNKGKTKKTWVTMLDDRVRDSHVVMEGKTIGIDDIFIVGTSKLRFPCDTMYDPDPSEIINCR